MATGTNSQPCGSFLKPVCKINCAAIPAIAPYLDVYAANIDQARLWVQDLVGTLMAKVVPAGDAAE